MSGLLQAQIRASNTVGGVAETRTVLKSVTNGRTYVCRYVQTGTNYMPLPLRGGDIKCTEQMANLQGHLNAIYKVLGILLTYTCS